MQESNGEADPETAEKDEAGYDHEDNGRSWHGASFKQGLSYFSFEKG